LVCKKSVAYRSDAFVFSFLMLEQYLPWFYRSDAFVFSFLMLEQYLPWFRELLESSIDFRRSLTSINQKNCVGTVLAVNGPRQYFSIYHAASERVAAHRRLREVRSQNPSDNTGLRNRHHKPTGGKFLGLEESDSDDEGSNIDAAKLFESDLVRGLGMWLDKLCEGTLKRFKVTEWPSMTASA